MSIDTFNNLTTQWNELIQYGIVRFAYVLSKDSVSEKTYTEKLAMQYDGTGTWIEAKDTDYDVEYVNNETIQISLYFSGDAKINYVG